MNKRIAVESYLFYFIYIYIYIFFFFIFFFFARKHSLNNSNVNALTLYIPCECRCLDNGYNFFYYFRHSINKKISMALPKKKPLVNALTLLFSLFDRNALSLYISSECRRLDDGYNCFTNLEIASRKRWARPYPEKQEKGDTQCSWCWDKVKYKGKQRLTRSKTTKNMLTLLIGFCVPFALAVPITFLFSITIFNYLHHSYHLLHLSFFLFPLRGGILMAHDADIKYTMGKQVDIGQRPQNTFNMNDRVFNPKKKKKKNDRIIWFVLE